jgi:hypothetical protein
MGKSRLKLVQKLLEVQLEKMAILNLQKLLEVQLEKMAILNLRGNSLFLDQGSKITSSTFGKVQAGRIDIALAGCVRIRLENQD